MAKGRSKSGRQYVTEPREMYQKDPMDIERSLVVSISETGKEQLKQRRKARLSSYYAKDGKIIEVLPDNTHQVRQNVRSKWVTVKKANRTVILK